MASRKFPFFVLLGVSVAMLIFGVALGYYLAYLNIVGFSSYQVSGFVSLP